MLPRPPTSPLFPYTTLFRSLRVREPAGPPPTFTRPPPRPAPTKSQPSATAPASSYRSGRRVRRLCPREVGDRKRTRLNSSHVAKPYGVLGSKKISSSV